MKLYRLTQDVTRRWDAWRSVIVAAENESEAAKIHPCKEVHVYWNSKHERFEFQNEWRGISCYGPRDWAEHVDQIEVEYVGEAASHIERGAVLCSSYESTGI